MTDRVTFGSTRYRVLQVVCNQPYIISRDCVTFGSTRYRVLQELAGSLFGASELLFHYVQPDRGYYKSKLRHCMPDIHGLPKSEKALSILKNSISNRLFLSTYLLHLLDISCKLSLLEKQFSRNVALFLSISSHSDRSVTQTCALGIFTTLCVPLPITINSDLSYDLQSISSDAGGRSIWPGKSLEITSRTATVT